MAGESSQGEATQNPALALVGYGGGEGSQLNADSGTKLQTPFKLGAARVALYFFLKVT